jgi:anti-sigma factor RsiW
MDQQAVGAAARSAPGAFSPVYFYSYQLVEATDAECRTVTTCSAGEEDAADAVCAEVPLRRVTLTDSSYVVTASGGFKATGRLLAGYGLAAGKTVVSVAAAVRRRGLYNLHTLAGDVVMDGVVASSNTTVVHPAQSRRLLAPLTAAYRALHATPALKGVLDLARPRVAGVAGPLVF